MSIKHIDLNCDLGESFGAYTMGNDEDVIQLVSSINVACGFHGGDPDVMDRTVAMAKENNVGIGAHPGYPDLLGFGRWNMDIPQQTLTNIIIYQIGALDAFCRKHGVQMQHVKPHGNLNNMADRNPKVATSIVDAVQALNAELPIFVKPNSDLERISGEKGQPVICELFADRGYYRDLSLVPRTEAGAVIVDPKTAAENVIDMVMQNKITAISGEEIKVIGETICVHGDTPSALHMIEVVKKELQANGIELAAPK